MRCDICGFESRDRAKFVPSRRRVRCLRCYTTGHLARRKEQIRSAMLAAKDRPCVDCGRQMEPERMHLEPRPRLSRSGRPIAHRTHAAFLREIKDEWAVRCEPCYLARRGGEGA
jgi:hypothetical protein